MDSIKKLIDAGKFTEAKKELEQYVANLKLSDKEEGEIYAEIASLYMKINTQILQSYKEYQEALIETLKDLKLKEKIVTQ